MWLKLDNTFACNLKYGRKVKLDYLPTEEKTSLVDFNYDDDFYVFDSKFSFRVELNSDTGVLNFYSIYDEKEETFTCSVISMWRLGVHLNLDMVNVRLKERFHCTLLIINSTLGLIIFNEMPVALLRGDFDEDYYFSKTKFDLSKFETIKVYDTKSFIFLC